MGLKEIMIISTIVAIAATLNSCIKQYEAETANSAAGAAPAGGSPR